MAYFSGWHWKESLVCECTISVGFCVCTTSFCITLNEIGLTTVPLKAPTSFQCWLIHLCTSVDEIGNRLASLTVTVEIAPLLATICTCNVTFVVWAPSLCNSCQAASESGGGGANLRTGVTPYDTEAVKKKKSGRYGRRVARFTNPQPTRFVPVLQPDFRPRFDHWSLI
jgi:hypothetical protein